MSGVMHISEAYNLALHALLALAARPGVPRRTPDLARAFGASGAHLAKVFQRLEHEGLVQGRRGPRGGFTLALAPGSVTLLRVFEAIEGPWHEVRCLLRRPVCDGSCCALGPLINQVNREAHAYLSGTTLAALTSPTVSDRAAGSGTPRSGLTASRRGAGRGWAAQPVPPTLRRIGNATRRDQR